MTNLPIPANDNEPRPGANSAESGGTGVRSEEVAPRSVGD